MKRLTITLALAFSLISFSSFANDITVTPAALQSFKTSFKDAKEVNWTVSENLYKANFQMNGQYVTAFYNAEGDMIAMTRNISSLQLPLSLQTSLKNGYENFWISDLFEMADENGTSYYITVENGDNRIVLKSTSGSDWSTYKKQRKA
jgi:hypothetical protein